MAFYTVMIPPPGSGGARDEIEQARLLPETFAWPAFVFGGLWLLGKRLWLATLIYVLLWGALLYAGSRFGLTNGAMLVAHWTIALFLGLEGHNLLARKLARQGWRLADVVEARDLSEAERRYFERALAGETAPSRIAPATPLRSQPTSPLPVIGLFPEAQGR
ncbi:DUF2628 domain-containing protein [Bosea sp. (in: a-proteobacteria)]|uniref:DUF2628 domain-containing protein n=1 Tax=Bosea sp. (in: a-proteobacteria) TaxID=1871050 RepID=UPI0027376A53|nr:DUF2628 domain-containing protein [Bosea sp. (in: a-proteobacteria)]MDP3257183.1 DUF2628 domain-containing protein [Bosea sp. (in: a-proteobacteria)]